MPTTSFPRYEGDVSGCFVLGMARALAQCGHEVEVIAPEPEHARDGELWTRCSPGVSVRWVPYARPRALQRTFHRAGAPDNLAQDPLAWLGAVTWPFALAGAMRARTRSGARRRWDAIVSHWGVPSGLVSSELRRGQRHVAFFHSGDVHALTRAARAGRILARRIARGSEAMVFVSSALRDRFLALAPEAAAKAHVIAMGVDAPIVIERDAARAALGCSGPTLLALGRLVSIKGIHRAIDAVATMPELTLVIAGAGPERARLEARARGSTGNVRFIGTVTGLEKARWLAAADALVVPSEALASGRTEGAPTAVIEALAAGLPVLATDTGGLPELVTHERSGLLIDSADPLALRAAITRFAGDAELRARLATGAAREGSGRTWASVAPRIDALLREPSPQGSMRRAAAGGRNENDDAGSRAFSS